MPRQPPSDSESVARDVAGRILALRKEGESDADFARRLGITPQLLNHYKKGGGASVEAVARITKSDPRAYWLLTGEEQHPEDEWEHLAVELVRFAGGERPISDAERRLIQRDILEGLLRIGRAEGRDRAMLARLEQMQAELAAYGDERRPPGSLRVPDAPRAADVLAFYDRESRAAELRAEGMREWAVAVRIAEEESRERRRGVSSTALTAAEMDLARQMVDATDPPPPAPDTAVGPPARSDRPRRRAQ